MLRLWLYYHIGAATGDQNHRRKLINIEETHTCCGWGPPLQCLPNNFYFNLTRNIASSAALAADRTDLIVSGATAACALNQSAKCSSSSSSSSSSSQEQQEDELDSKSIGNIAPTVPFWWRHDVDGSTLMRSDHPGVEALQRCSRAYYDGLYAPSQFCLVSEDGTYRSAAPFDERGGLTAGDSGTGNGSRTSIDRLSPDAVDFRRPSDGHGGCPYLFPVSPGCVREGSTRPGCAVPF